MEDGETITDMMDTMEEMKNTKRLSATNCSVLVVLIVMELLTISAWNMRSLNGAEPYINKLVQDYGSDILCISEHRLHDFELHKLNNIGIDFDYVAKSSSDLN